MVTPAERRAHARLVESARLCALVEAGRIAEAVDLVRPLTADCVHDLVAEAAHAADQSGTYADFAEVVAASRAGSDPLGQVGFIGLASLLLTGEAASPDGYRRAYELRLHAVRLLRDALAANLDHLQLFKHTPGPQLAPPVEAELRAWAHLLRDWDIPRG